MPNEEAAAARPVRDSRLNIRTSAKQDKLIRQAAQAVDKSMSEFVLDSATATAEHVLADRRYFAVSDDAWQAFEAALERPAVFKPRLQELLNEDSPFEPQT
ncbi:type II toxin-antitoxin system TacA family antitoxin [Phytoactinopolyspora halotolerans]|uniref:DUF1778 domain-containing protein n=1 Tax=Phytoactinopolyspora halotolerans TaxID=1981512 RepID=A0A6L9S244_9ACTN|nr:DUF1778 domain-containing protein [Phytoactinopolyspora halotolerans]NED99295.1 DUF1778 domain-containing protein [Phytoactinopolyspora halotolerans]